MNRFRIFLLAIAVVFFQPAADAAVKILKISGNNVYCPKLGKPFKKLKSTSTFDGKGNVIIKTGEHSFVDLQLENAVLVRITQNSQMGIDRSTTEGDDREVKLDCREGRIVCVSKTLSRYSKFEVKTPVGVCGARKENPEFDINSNGQVRCVAGEVVMVFVVNGVVTPPATLGPGEMTIIPTSGNNYKNKDAMDAKALLELSDEIADLKKSAANLIRRK